MITEIMERHIKSICNEYASYVVEKLSSKYEFDAEEAMRELELPIIKRDEPAAPRRKALVAEKKSKPEKRLVPSIPLPFCGKVIDGWCKAIVKNNKLYTQCTNSPTKDEICTKCDNLLKKDGELPFGLITSRMECDIFSYKDNKGNVPLPYTVIMAKMDITREKAIEEAAKFGITIPEEHFVVVEKARGRPKKDVAEKSDDDETDKKNRGRPKKDKPVKATSKVGDDIIAGLLQQAKDNGEIVEEKSSQSQEETQTQEEETTDKAVEKPAPKTKANKTDKEAEKAAAKAAKEAEKAAAKAAKEAEKTAKEAEKAAAKEAEKEAAKAAKKTNAKEAPAPKKHDDKTPAAPKVDNEEGVSETKSCEQESYSDEEEDGEEQIKVKKFEFQGKKYKRSEPDNILYDWDDDEPVGVWNPNTKTIDELPEDIDEEDDE